MPELPEVETVRKGLTDCLDGFCINKVDVCRDRAIASSGGKLEFIEMLSGKTIGKWERRGKYLIASLHIKKKPKKSAPQGWLVVHLRMTGYFKFLDLDTAPCSHTRVRLWNKQGKELRFVDVRSFGQMWWIAPESSPKQIITGLSKLGPEPFSKEFNSVYLKKKFQGRKRSIKAALLDQSIVAGVGNIYADESLFMSGIVPAKACSKLTQEELKNLCINLVKVLKKSIGKGGTTFSDFRDLKGINGNYGGEAWVYRRGGKPCRKCGTLICKEKIAGRSTHWCTQCQI